MADSSKENIKQEHLNIVSTALHSLRSVDSGYTDASIECEGITFNVHKAVLHAGSAYFAAMFQSEMIEAATCKAELDSVDSHSLKLVLDFIYTGDVECVDEDEKTLQAVIRTAHLLRVDLLYEYCWSKLKNKLNPKYFLEIWNMAELYSHEEILQEISVLVTQNFTKISKSNEFDLLSASQLNRILTSNRLTAPTEQIISTTMKWVRYKEKERAIHVSMLLSNIVVEDLSNRFLAKLATDTLIKTCEPLYDKCLAAALSRLESNNLFSGPRIVGFTTANTVISYSLNEGKWDREKALPFPIIEGMTTVEWEGCIYFFGGEYDKEFISPSVYHYLPDANGLEAVGKLHTPVKNLKIGMSDGQFYIFGKEKKKTDKITVQEYSPVSRKGMTVGYINNKGDSYCIFNWANKIYIGIEGNYTVEIKEYDTSSYSLKKVNFVPGIPLSNNVRQCFNVYNQQLYVLQSSKADRVRVYNPQTKQWMDKSLKTPTDSALSLLSVTNKNKELSFLVLWAVGKIEIYLYRVDNEVCDEVARPIIEDGTFCNCVVMNH